MPALLIAEHENGSIKDATNKALTAASKLGTPVTILVAGAGCAAAGAEAAKLEGVAKVLVADGPALEHYLAENMAALIVSIAKDYDYVIAPATTRGKNILPRVAALLDVMQVSDVMTVVSPDTFERPIYAGNAIQTVQSTDVKKVLTIRTAAFQATGAGSATAPVESVDVAQSARSLALRGRGNLPLRQARPDSCEDHRLRRAGARLVR